MRHLWPTGAFLLITACTPAEPRAPRPWFDTPEMASLLEAGALCDSAYAPARSIDAEAYVGPIIPKPVCDGGPCDDKGTCGSFRKDPIEP